MAGAFGHNAPMARVHWFELEDQAWFPSVIRDAGTGYLRLAARLGGHAKGIAAKLAEVFERSGTTRIVDLCSGGGGPIPALVETLAQDGIDVRVTLTDYYPNVQGLEELRRTSGGKLDYVAESVDATAVPASLQGVRTLFNALHHFRPELARRILQNAVDDGRPIVAIEFVGRHPAVLLGIPFVPLVVALAVPFLRPFRWGWLPLTYLIPVIPLFVMWDGFVSCLRVYSEDELHELVASLEGGDRFDWEIGTLPLRPAPASYLIGVARGDRGA